VLVLTAVEFGPGAQAGPRVVFLENFFDELRRRVPTGKLGYDCASIS
jgi:hypothetical protein